MKIKANFFWHNNKKFTFYEYACVNSFVKNNFDVNVYSYENIKLPKNAKLKDASKIISKKHIYKYNHQGKKGCLAAFADKFRIELLKKDNGWYFDTDVMCLKNSSHFFELEKNNKIIIGLETNNNINNAVLRINDTILLDTISKRIDDMGFTFNWGEIGPKLLTSILKETKQFSFALKQYYFYPLNYKDNFKILLLPEFNNKAIEITKNSYVCHNYNQILTRFGIPKNIMPPKNSFLYNKFIKSSPELKKIPHLPLHTAIRLLDKKNGFRENVYDFIPSLIRALFIRALGWTSKKKLN